MQFARRAKALVARICARLSPYAREISLILIVKALLLGLIWWAFFSEPVARHMRVEPAQIDQVILNAPSPETPHAHR